MLENLEKEFENLKNPLINLSMKYQKNFTDAEDVVSETFIQVIEKKDLFQGHSSLKTWIYSICIRKNLESLRKKKTYFNHLKSFFLESWNEVSGNGYDYLALNSDLQEALDKLKEKEKSVFVLNVFEDFSQKEIAEVLEMSVSNVKVTLHRARKKLIEILGEWDYRS